MADLLRVGVVFLEGAPRGDDDPGEHDYYYLSRVPVVGEMIATHGGKAAYVTVTDVLHLGFDSAGTPHTMVAKIGVRPVADGEASPWDDK